MSDKKVTDIMLERIKYFVNSVENGEYELNGYEFAITLHSEPYNDFKNKVLNISDRYTRKV